MWNPPAEALHPTNTATATKVTNKDTEDLSEFMTVLLPSILAYAPAALPTRLGKVPNKLLAKVQLEGL
jgi:hypothetical protein